jgi:hypothetical protein
MKDNAMAMAKRLAEAMHDVNETDKEVRDCCAACDYDADYFCHDQIEQHEAAIARLADCLIDLKAWVVARDKS